MYKRWHNFKQTHKYNWWYILGESELTGSVNLMAYYGLEHTYSKFSGKRLKESLSSFLPNLPGIVDTPGHNDQR